eukprot:763398-Hanusia_phi.AAC.3
MQLTNEGCGDVTRRHWRGKWEWRGDLLLSSAHLERHGHFLLFSVKQTLLLLHPHELHRPHKPSLRQHPLTPPSPLLSSPLLSSPLLSSPLLSSPLLSSPLLSSPLLSSPLLTLIVQNLTCRFPALTSSSSRLSENFTLNAGPSVYPGAFASRTPACQSHTTRQFLGSEHNEASLVPDLEKATAVQDESRRSGTSKARPVMPCGRSPLPRLVRRAQVAELQTQRKGFCPLLPAP